MSMEICRSMRIFHYNYIIYHLLLRLYYCFCQCYFVTILLMFIILPFREREKKNAIIVATKSFLWNTHMVSFACFIAGISTCFVKNELYSYVIGIHFVLIDDNKYLIQMHWLIKLRWQVTSSSIRFVSSTSWKPQNDWKAPF